MSLKYRDVTGKETPIAGLNGLSGELVPSVSYYQRGSYTFAVGTVTTEIVFEKEMPDTDYVVNISVRSGDYEKCSFVTQSYKTTGFTLKALLADGSSARTNTVTVGWKAFKLMTDESRAIDEAAIAQNASDIATLKTQAAVTQVPITVAVSGVRVDCYRCGNVVTVSVNTTSHSIDAGATVASGFPAPRSSDAYFLVTNVSGTPASRCISLGDSGLMKAYTALTTYTVGCFSYIAKD